MESISPESQRTVAIRYRATAGIIVAQIVLATVLILAVWLFAPKPADKAPQETLTTLWALIVFLALGAFVLRRIFFRWDSLKDTTLLKGISGLLSILQRNAVILSIFATAITIVGSVITVLSGDTLQMLRVAVVGLIVFLINFPRRAVWEKIVAGMEKV